MKVRCVNNDGWGVKGNLQSYYYADVLTVGKIYEVLKDMGEHIHIINDKSKLCGYLFDDKFEIVE